ncbi:trypsin-like peptidase domain-containing protein [Candidatus Peregrinibacteria bacterium]|nr:trypsin-like peptidase domain-containing protein [Candidatus Peregrinibacteria bacterium]
MNENKMLRGVVIGGLSGAVCAALVSLAVIYIVSPQLLNSANNIVSETSKQPVKEQQAVVTGSQEELVVQAVEKAAPAVVSIIITKDVPKLEQYFETYKDPFYDNFFGPGFGGTFQIPQYRQNGTEKKEVGGGSGFIVSSDGYIVSNRHVVDDETAEYTVILNDGTKHDAKIIARDSIEDVAVLKIEATDLPYLNFGDSEGLKLGQSVIAIGNPLLEFNNSVSVGVISGLSRSITAGGLFTKPENLDDVIQTDAAINPGNSGGPLLNLKGEVIGMNVAIADGQNIGFSLPSNNVKTIVESVKETGKITRPYLGLRYVPITKEIKESNKLSVDYGVLVVRGETVSDLAVIPGSPADKAGLAENDIILEIDGVKLEEGVSLTRIISQKKIDDTVTLKILHKGEEKEVKVELNEMPE